MPREEFHPTLLLLSAGPRHQEKIPAATRSRLGWICFEMDGKPTASWRRRPAAGNYAAEMKRIFRAVFDEHRLGAHGGELRARLLVQELLILVAQLARRERGEPAVSRSRLIAEAATQTIRGNLRRPLALRELAARVSC